MATTAQILANQHNAQHSSGPKTAAGKAVSSQNALRHGLSGSCFALLPGEDPGEFQQVLQSLQSEHQPQNDGERFLIQQAAKARWRILRIDRLEAEALEDILTAPDDSGASSDGRVLAAMKTSGNILDKLQRYAAAAERSYYKALRELQAGRARALRDRTAAAEAYIDQYVFAPIPELAARARQAQANAPAQNEPDPRVQNEPKPPTPAKPAVAARDLGNLALRL